MIMVKFGPELPSDFKMNFMKGTPSITTEVQLYIEDKVVKINETTSITHIIKIHVYALQPYVLIQSH